MLGVNFPPSIYKSSRCFAKACGKVCTPYWKERRRVFGRVAVWKCLNCVRSVQAHRGCAPTTGGQPRQTNFCSAASWVLSQVREKAPKKQILQRGIVLFIMAMSYLTGSGVKFPSVEGIGTLTLPHRPEAFIPSDGA